MFNTNVTKTLYFYIGLESKIANYWLKIRTDVTLTFIFNYSFSLKNIPLPKYASLCLK